MIDLYASGSPNVLRIFIALEEIAFEYRVRRIDIFKGEQFSSEFINMNPNGKVPVIVDHLGPDGAPYTVFESAPMLLYLAEKAGQLLPSGKIARYETLQWLTVQVTTVGPMLGQLVHFQRYAPKQPTDYAENRYSNQARRVFEVMDRRLGSFPFVAGDEYTIADIALFPWTRNITSYLGGRAEAAFSNLLNWRHRIAERPAVIRAISAHAKVQSTSVDQADPAILDRVFGRNVSA
jgi:GSH-dependent disulfide-bond oxidoreductase